MKNLKLYTLAFCLAIACCHGSIDASSTTIDLGRGVVVTKNKAASPLTENIPPASQVTVTTTQEQRDLIVLDAAAKATEEVAQLLQTTNNSPAPNLPGSTVSTKRLNNGNDSDSDNDWVTENPESADPEFSYTVPLFPDQKATSPGSGKWLAESYLAYVLRLIKAGQFGQAHEKAPNGQKNDPSIGEHSGRALDDTINQLTAKLDDKSLAIISLYDRQSRALHHLLKTQEKERQDQIKEQHNLIQTALDQSLLLIQASLQPSGKGSISQQRIEEALSKLSDLQRRLETTTDSIDQSCAHAQNAINATLTETTRLGHQELKEREKAIRLTRELALKAHPAPEQTKKISPVQRSQDSNDKAAPAKTLSKPE